MTSCLVKIRTLSEGMHGLLAPTRHPLDAVSCASPLALSSVSWPAKAPEGWSTPERQAHADAKGETSRHDSLRGPVPRSWQEKLQRRAAAACHLIPPGLPEQESDEGHETAQHDPAARQGRSGRAFKAHAGILAGVSIGAVACLCWVRLMPATALTHSGRQFTQHFKLEIEAK